LLIETPRLALRPIKLDDLDEFVAPHADPEMTQFISPLDRAAAEERLHRDASEWEQRGHGLLAVPDRENGAFLGRCGLKYWPQFEMPYLTAMISPGNLRSVRVAERLGLARLRDDVLLDDPVVVYAIDRASPDR
jgi:RimJ/RimL family protein N-acetyltransferase